MLIKALCDYAIKNPSTIPKGFEEKQINYRIILSTDGDIVDIVPFTRTIHTKNKTETEPQIALLPKRSQKSGRSYDSNYIEHRPLYIFGLNYDAENNTFTPDDKTNKAKNSHKAFVEHELEFFKDLDSVACTAYKRFIEKWNPENEIDNPFLLQLGKNYAESYYGFSVDCESNYLETDEQFIQKYTKLIQDTEQKLATDTENTAICGILGIKDRIAETHDKVTIPGGPSRLVSMKLNAFESYGVKKSYNSNISNTAMKMYTDALNRLFKDKIYNDPLLGWIDYRWYTRIKLIDYEVTGEDKRKQVNDRSLIFFDNRIQRMIKSNEDYRKGINTNKRLYNIDIEKQIGIGIENKLLH